MSQLPLLARARYGDSETSWIAAANVTNLSQTHERILECLIQGKATDAEIVERYRERFGFDASEQSIRSRRAELVKAGLVSFTGDYGISPSGLKARKWGRV